MYLNLQDDNGMFRNRLNCISSRLTETAVLWTLLDCKDTYYMHCCLLHFTETNKLSILIKTRPSKETNTSSNWRLVTQQLSISYVPLRSEHWPPVCHPPSPSAAWTNHQCCHSVVRENTRFHDKKNTRFTKKYWITKANLHTVKMPRKCIAMPTMDIVQLIVNQRQRKREIEATLVFVCKKVTETFNR